jgi:tripartite motif-containing protein 71
LREIADPFLQRFNYECELICVIGEEGSGRYQFNHPISMCSIGDEFYISDHLNCRIVVFNTKCKITRMFGSRGSGNGQFDGPLGLAAGPGPELFVCDAGNYRVQVLQPDGSYVRSIGCQGTGPGQFSEYPQRVAVTSTGYVLVIDTKGSTVYMFRTSGEYLRQLADSIPVDPKPPRQTGITVDRDNNIIIADKRNHRLVILSGEGQYKCQIGVGGSQSGLLKGPWDVSVSRGGDIVVYEAGAKRLQVLGV